MAHSIITTKKGGKNSPSKENPFSLDSIRGSIAANGFVLLQGEVSREAATNAAQELLALQIEGQREGDNSPLALLINSQGGKVDPGWYLYDVIKSSSRPIHGIVIGDAHSTANVILQACHQRVGLPHSRGVLHYQTSDRPIRFDPLRLARSTKLYERHALEYAAMWEEAYTSRGVRKSALREILDAGSYDEFPLTARQMLRHRIIDRIISRVMVTEPYRLQIAASPPKRRNAS